MNKLFQIYKCEKCGTMVEVIHAGDGELVCCGQPMKLINEDSVDAAVEKHVPVVEKRGNGYHVKVGEVRHPMEEKHSIEWIELVTPNGVYRRYLSPKEDPEALFEEAADAVAARAYCNLHGLWKADIKTQKQ